MLQSPEINELATAFNLAQGEMHAAKINKVNPHFKNRYADLSAVIDAVREPLAKNGLSFTQTTEMDALDNGTVLLVLVTTLLHKSGQWKASTYPLPTTGTEQQRGSAITYARRYCLSAIAGIASEEDDDGQAAVSGQSKVVQEAVAAAAARKEKKTYDAGPLDD